MAGIIATQIDDVLISPLERILTEVARGVAEAQRQLDLNSVATQTQLANDPLLRELGLETTWYHIPEVELEIKLSLSLRREDRMEGDRLLVRRFRMYAAPFNATYQSSFQADVAATSQLRARIVSIPPASRPGV